MSSQPETAAEQAQPASQDRPLPLAELLKDTARPVPVPEIGGRRDGPDPTRYGDWEKNGRCIDF